MNVDYDGAQLIDSAGEQVGTIERSYVDDGGVVRFLEVRMGSVMPKHRLVPADQAEQLPDGVRVPYVKDMIEESPDASSGDTLEAEELERARAYYAEDSGSVEDRSVQDSDDNADDSSGAAPTEAELRHRPANDYPDPDTQEEPAPADLGRVRDLGDVVEVPIVEEVLVKKPVVKEVLRIRKTDLVERGTAAADLRRETVEVLPSGEGLVQDTRDASGDTGGEA